MLELLVISDTHGDVAALSTIFSWARRRGLGALAFLGDGIPDLELASEATGFHPAVTAVRGNGDVSSTANFHGVLDFAERRFFLCHGHTFGVQDSYGPLLQVAKMAGATAALHGHTHLPFWDDVSGLLVLNPGSPSRPRGGAPRTFATIGCPEDGSWFFPRHWVVDGGSSISPLDTY